MLLELETPDWPIEVDARDPGLEGDHSSPVIVSITGGEPQAQIDVINNVRTHLQPSLTQLAHHVVWVAFVRRSAVYGGKPSR